MKKTVFVLMLLISMAVLSSCKDDDVTDYGVRIVSETFVADAIDVHAVIGEDVQDMALLVEVSLEIAAMTYQKHNEAIGFDTVTMTIHLYGSDADFESETETFGHQVFEINASAQEPGISLTTDALTLD